MPELPEVQTVLDTLALRIKDKKIINVEILYSNIISMDDEQFKDKIINQAFRNFKRRGKYLLFELDDYTLVSHLRMEGKYYIKQRNEPLNKHTHVIFQLDDGSDLRYNDVRKFGRMELIDIPDNYQFFHDLGPEPFSSDLNFEYVKKYLNKSRKLIKQDLLDQHFVAGVGNIYADEICYFAKVMPTRESKTITDSEIKLLIDGINQILSQAIKDGGTTIRSYTSSLGVTGRFQLNLMVHQRYQEECKVCKTQIEKCKVKGRTTYYCPNCQK